MTQYELKGKGFLLLVLTLVSIILLSSRLSIAQTSSRVERKADRYFLRGNYDKSTFYYERGLSQTSKDSPLYSSLELKLAKIYSLLQDKPKAIEHFDNVFANADSLLSIDDIYLYTDALRRVDLRQKAEKVIRHYAFKGTYFRNQRFVNTLNSLSNQSYYYQKGLTSYNVRRLDTVSSYSNYWIGEYDSQPFFAQSRSGKLTSHDKIIYHQTRYRKFGDSFFDEDMVFNEIPIQLQEGPMAYNKRTGLLVVTSIAYDDNDRVDLNNMVNQGYSSTIHYSRYDSITDRWTAFLPLAENTLYDKSPIGEDLSSASSYAHPSFFNDGNSLIFASDRLGGYGGMDLYITHWNEELQAWEEPENLGRQVNSEGDELYPRIYGGALFFASNGIEGFGGFDNYRISFAKNSFGKNITIPGTLFHYPYPVNSTHNDFGFFFHKGNGYFVSDRQENGQDNMFVFVDAPTSLSRDGAIGVSKEYSAMRGDLDIIEKMSASNVIQQRSDINLREFVDKTEYKQLYFNFDSKLLTATTEEELDELLKNLDASDIKKVLVVGYADMIGSAIYNENLSFGRAERVAKYLRKRLPGVLVESQGRGVYKVPEEDKLEINNYMRTYLLTKEDTATMALDINSSIQVPNNQAIIDFFRQYRKVEIIITNKHNYNN